MKSALIDSSAFLSLADPSEPSHDAVRAAFDQMLDEGSGLLTTNFVFDETYTLILSRLGRGPAVDWGESLRRSRSIAVVQVDEDHEAAAWDLLLTFADKDFSYTDATSFAVATALRVDDAIAVDRHFHQFGRFRVLPDDLGRA